MIDGVTSLGYANFSWNILTVVYQLNLLDWVGICSFNDCFHSTWRRCIGHIWKVSLHRRVLATLY